MLDENGKVVFNEQEQAELDRIVGERLARVKKETPEDYNDLKEISDLLEEFQFAGTAAEKKEALKQVRMQQKQQEEYEYLQQQADEEGITPALAKKIKDLEDKLEKSNKVISEITGEREAKINAEKAKIKADELWNKQVQEFQEEYADVDLEELAKNQKFIKFIKGRELPLKENYAYFLEFISESEAETIAKVKFKDMRSTSSGKGESSDGGTYGLSERQKTLAKNNGLSYKEYAEYLKQIQ